MERKEQLNDLLWYRKDKRPVMMYPLLQIEI